jgi:hypothetical protein
MSCKQEMKVIFTESVPDGINQYDYIIVIYFDTSDCTGCSLSQLDLWKIHQKILGKYNTGILLVFHNSDENNIINILKSKRVTFPFIFDKNGKLKANNKIFESAENKIFVMDKNRNVIFPDSPIKSEKNWTKFIKIVTP